MRSVAMSRLKSHAPRRSAPMASSASGESARAASASSSSARPISRGRSSRPSKWRVRRSPSIDAASTSEAASSAIGPPPDASRCVTSSCPAPGSRQGMWLTDARPASTVSATKHQPQRGSAIPVATRTWRRHARRPPRGSHPPRPPAPSRRHRTGRRGSRSPVRARPARRLDEDREREVTARAPAGTGSVANEPLGRSWWRPARVPSIADGTRTCLKPGPAGFVSPWMSRTSRLSYRS